jgi:lipopolysaccharide transport system permease protein
MIRLKHGREAWRVPAETTRLRCDRLLYLTDLARVLVARNIKIIYRGSILGMLWSLITPLLQLVIYYFLFQKVLSLRIPRYSLFALSGILAWNWFQSSLIQSVNVVRGSRELVKQPGFPTAVLPATAVATTLITFLISLGVLILLLLFGGTLPGAALFALPGVVAVQSLFMLALVYLVAALNILFLDTQHILGIVLQLFFFLTPVVYDIKSIPEEYHLLYVFNPMTHFVDAYRSILIDNDLPSLWGLSIILIVSIFILPVACIVFKRTNDRFVEEL